MNREFQWMVHGKAGSVFTMTEMRIILPILTQMLIQMIIKTVLNGVGLTDILLLIPAGARTNPNQIQMQKDVLLLMETVVGMLLILATLQNHIFVNSMHLTILTSMRTPAKIF